MEEDPGAALTIVGDLPLVVEALQAGAAPGTILCSEATARLVRDVVRLEAVPSVPMTDGSHPLSTYTILGVCPPSVPLTLHGGRARSRFVGRTRELAALHALLARAEAGYGQAVGIVGEPGIGKSRLIMEWRQQLPAPGVASLAGHGLSYGSTTPYLPVLDLLREHCGITPADDADVISTKVCEGLQAVGLAPEARAPALLHLLGVGAASELGTGVSPEVLKAQAFETLWQLCLQCSQQHPLVIMVDDLHWNDPTSEEFFALLVERLPGTAILFVGTYRPGYQPSWLGKSYASQVPLPPLSAQDSAEVIRTMFQEEPVPAVLEHAILAKAQGNPFFLEELAQTVVEQGAAGRQGFQLPLTVQGVLAARLDRLPQEAKHLVQCAAVIGTDVSVPLLQAIAEIPEAALQRALAHLQAAEFLSETRLIPERSYTFKHTLTQEVVYESLLQERQRVLHAGIVEALERLAPDRLADQVAQLAYHAVRGAVWDKALTYGRQAGARAYDRAAFREAVTFFEQALAALAQFPERRDTLEQAIDVRLDLRHALQTLDEQARVFDHLREAEALAERLGDDRRLGQIVRHLAFYFSTMGEYDRAIAACQRALALATASDAFDVQVAVETTLNRTYYSGGDFRQALDIARRTITLLTGEQHSANFGRGNLPAVVSRVCMAGCLAELGSFAEGRSVAEDAVRVAEAAEQPYYIGGALLLAGVLYRRQGNVHRAVAALERGLALSQTADSPRLFPAAASLLSAAYAMAGRAAEALSLLDQTLERVATASYTIFHTTVLTELSDALCLVGRCDEAGALAGRLLALSRTHPGRGYQAHAYRLLGEVAAQRHPPEWGQAEGYYCQALALAEELGMRPLVAHCHRGLGTLYAKTGQAGPACTALSIAIMLYHAMDMTFWLPQTKAVLSAVGGAYNADAPGVATLKGAGT
jgi:predicted ATPase